MPDKIIDKVAALRADLEMQITKLDIQQGNIVVVQPKNPSYILPDQYRAWIIDVFQHVAPGIPVIVLGDNQLEFKVEKDSINERYS